MRIDDWYRHPKFGVLKYMGCPNGKLIFENYTQKDDGTWIKDFSTVELDPGVFKERLKRKEVALCLAPC